MICSNKNYQKWTTAPSEVSPTNNPEIPYSEWKEIGEEIIELEGLLKGRAPAGSFPFV